MTPESSDQDSAAKAPVRSVVLPVGGDALMLPSAMLSEVVHWEDIDEHADGPDWMLGSLPWRGRQLPVVWLGSDPVCIATDDRTRPRKLAVVYALAACAELRYYALVCDAVPRPVLATAGSIRVSASSPHTSRRFCAVAVHIDGESAFIPDVGALEAALLEGAEDWLGFAADDAQLSIVEGHGSHTGSEAVPAGTEDRR